MHTLSKAAAVLLFSTLTIGSAHSQVLNDGALTGDILSASAEVDFGSTESLLLVPNDRVYVLTQTCVRPSFSPGPGSVSGSTLGPVVSSVTNTTCTAYSPGIAFQGGEEVSFTATAPFPGQPGSASVTITGVLVDPNPASGGGDDDD